MDIKQRVGRYLKSSSVGGESYNAYIPQPLPPKPALDMTAFYPLLDQANTAIGRLDGMSMVLPEPSLFLYMYVRKEAVLSSQIEGTQSSLSDLLLLETQGDSAASLDDVKEVSCYVSAMYYGLKRVKKLPLSLRLIKEIHAQLMNNARSGNKHPGEFRNSQNWIGGTRPGNAKFIPPPPEHLMECLDNFEKFLHDDTLHLPILIKAALAHVQFETIHPFLDGNGRLGRLLITFMLCLEGIIKQPILYLSLYLKSNRDAYYGHLQSVRETGDWESWIKFFLTGIIETAQQATETAQSIIALFAKDYSVIENSGKSSAAIFTIYDYLKQYPIANTKKIKESIKLSLPTILRSLAILENLKIIKEITGKDRHKIFVYDQYLAIINSGTERSPN
ncbi:MAG: Fic family protein [Holosporaceae bacterium]|jgi:Fic family protein|nr:Fic family protein [Holosporaceae bacterium]